MFAHSRPTRLMPMLPMLLVGGCILAPTGTRHEQDRAAQAGKNYASSIEKRAVVDIAQPAMWPDVLRRAFKTNGELESAYFEWAAALARIPQVATYPNSNIAPSFGYMFSGERMT